MRALVSWMVRTADRGKVPRQRTCRGNARSRRAKSRTSGSGTGHIGSGRNTKRRPAIRDTMLARARDLGVDLARIFWSGIHTHKFTYMAKSPPGIANTRVRSRLLSGNSLRTLMHPAPALYSSVLQDRTAVTHGYLQPERVREREHAKEAKNRGCLQASRKKCI